MEKVWLTQMFNAQALGRDGMVRRSVQDVNEFASEAELLAAVQSRGFALIRSGAQYIVLTEPGFEIIGK